MSAVPGDRPPVVALLSATIDMAYLVPAFRAACPGIDLRLQPDLGPLDDIDAAVCWVPPPGLLARMPRLQLLQSVGAGIDHMTADPQLPALPLCRIVDPDMAAGMRAYVAWAVVHRQRCMADCVHSAQQALWQEPPVQPPREHRVGIAGFGTLGRACAEGLAALGYSVRGWRRHDDGRPAPQGVELYHGEAARAEFLAGCDTLVNLLPLTPQTRDLLDARWFSQMPRGAHLINVGRGDHVVDADLLAALDSGQLGAATLDAFRCEPLPPAHPFWGHPRILVTPHIATRTAPQAIARQTLANLAAVRAGQAAQVAVDRHRGY
ncbi:glyoxylate/hydroxypyruvate reductase A [uncultured Aquincola sp.]|uniref:2-hydroxyacid dehydrogenase n=1 Tax=uncultured Aquincola sp. TaxID=886556 RepID=UPI0032B12F6B